MKIKLALALLLSPLARTAVAAPDKVKLDLYVMSLCPFGVQAENGVLPAVKSLDKHIDFNLHFIGSQAPGQGGLPQFTALHGEPETAENIRQVCAKTLSADKYMDYILERNKAGVRSPEWKGAAQAAGMAPAQIAKMEECSKGPQGAAWYSKSIEASSARGANASPTVDIDGRPYTRARTQGWVTLALCDAMKSKGIPLPKACSEAAALAASEKSSGADGGCGGPAPGGPSAPSAGQQAGAGAAAPVAFDITVVTEESCAICAPTLLDNMAALHPAAKIKTVDADSKEGRELIKLHGAKTLPLYVLDSKVEGDANFARLLPVAYYKSRDGYLIRHGPTNFFPSVWLERKRVPRRLDIFLEGLSSASILAEQDLIRFLAEEEKALGDLTLSLHFVAREATVPEKAETPQAADAPVRAASLSELGGAPGDLSSPRGEAEIAEDVRQLCTFQHAPLGAYLSYLACRHQNVQNPQWAQQCLPKAEKDVKSCITGKEGLNLLRKDARLVRELDITRAAPVFLWENRYGPFGWNEMDWRGLFLGRKETAGKTAQTVKR